jgi:plasmid stability protein
MLAVEPWFLYRMRFTLAVSARLCARSSDARLAVLLGAVLLGAGRTHGNREILSTFDATAIALRHRPPPQFLPRRFGNIGLSLAPAEALRRVVRDFCRAGSGILPLGSTATSGALTCFVSGLWLCHTQQNAKDSPRSCGSPLSPLRTLSGEGFTVLPMCKHSMQENHLKSLARCTGRFPQLAHPRSRLTVDMRLTCTHAYHMSKMVQIRNVPEALHRKLKVRAADAGQTLSDYLLAELERLAGRPTRDEMLTRLHGRKRVTLKTPAAVVVRDERESA